MSTSSASETSGLGLSDSTTLSPAPTPPKNTSFLSKVTRPIVQFFGDSEEDLSVLNDGVTEANKVKHYTTWEIYKRIYQDYIRPYKWRTLVALLITIPIGSLDGAIAFSLKPYIDGMTGKGPDLNVSYIPFVVVGFTLLQGVLNYISIYTNGWVGFKIMSDLRRDLFEKLHRIDVKTFDKNTSGWVIARFYRDPESLQMNMLQNSKQILTRLFSSLFLCGVLVYQSWDLAIIAITVMLMTIFPATQIRKVIKRISSDMTVAASAMMTFYTESFTGIRVVQGFNLKDHRLKQFMKLQNDLFGRYIKRTQAQGWLTPIMHTIASIGIALIIWRGSDKVLQGELTTGAFTSFMAALIMLYNPLKNLGASMMSAQFSMIAATRMFSLLDLEPRIRDLPDAKPLKGIRDGIEFQNVTFSYRAGYPVLKDVSFKVKKGEKVAIVGRSGSGKSTVANLIPRFYDVKRELGAVCIDGVNVRDLKLKDLRKQIGLVMQDNFLFEGTIRSNLMVGNPKATEAQLWEALEQAYLKDFIEGMESGLETTIGERGVLLSGGQRQRLAIARTILKDAPVVILDEATSALDNEAEAIVHKALEALMVNRTVIIIAHRLSTIRNVDRILVMDAGELVESGTHDELLALNGAYSRLYYAQEAAEPENETASDVESGYVDSDIPSVVPI